MPLPFVDGVLQVLCMLVILMGYVCLTLVNLDSLYCLVKKYKVTAFYLTGRGHSPILVGVSLDTSSGTWRPSRMPWATCTSSSPRWPSSCSCRFS